jgi:hypothetical protein
LPEASEVTAWELDPDVPRLGGRRLSFPGLKGVCRPLAVSRDGGWAFCLREPEPDRCRVDLCVPGGARSIPVGDEEAVPTGGCGFTI